MSRKCDITGKTGLNGNRVSHAHNKTHHVQQPNVKKKRVYVPELKRHVTVKLSSKGLKVLNRQGAYKALKARGLL
jgi:large subunit ribosomal protein L28